VHHADKYLVLEPFYCEVCYLTFRTPNELTEHRKAHEEFKCEVCSKLRTDRMNFCLFIVLIDLIFISSNVGKCLSTNASLLATLLLTTDRSSVSSVKRRGLRNLR
jgi:hypothetical protein